MISIETAKKELGFWVSHGVIKESELQRVVGENQADILTETVFFASKTLERNHERAFDTNELSAGKMKAPDDSSFEDSFCLEDKVLESAQQHLFRILKESPGGRSLRQLQESLKGPFFMNKHGQGLSELKIKEILD